MLEKELADLRLLLARTNFCDPTTKIKRFAPGKRVVMRQFLPQKQAGRTLLLWMSPTPPSLAPQQSPTSCKQSLYLCAMAETKLYRVAEVFEAPV